MNQISRHISYLLLTCRKVTVEGLCTFSASFEHASFDPMDEVFYPAKLRVKVSKNICDEKKLLIESMQRKLNLNHSEVEEMVDNFVNKVKAKLNKQNYCRLEGIGYLFKDEKGNLLLKDTFWKRNTYLGFYAV